MSISAATAAHLEATIARRLGNAPRELRGDALRAVVREAKELGVGAEDVVRLVDAYVKARRSAPERPRALPTGGRPAGVSLLEARVAHGEAVGSQRPVAGRDPIARLNAHARALLAPDGALQARVDERLTRLGVDPRSVPPLAEKFLLDVPPGAWPARGTPVAALERTLDSAAEFIADMHVKSRGRGNAYFSTVEIQPYRAVRDDFHLDARTATLTIGLERDAWTLWTGYRTPSAAALERAWDHGEQFSNPRLQRWWPLLDPQGELRSTLRATIGDNAREVLRELSALARSTSLAEAKHGLRRLIAERTNGDARGPRGTLLMAEAETLLSRVHDPATLRALLLRFARGVADDGLASSSLVAVQQAVLQRSLDAKIDIRAGLVAVGNLHDISVSAALAGGGGGLERYVTEVPQRRSLDVQLRAGLVGVFTVDVVDVDAAMELTARAVSSQKVHVTAALDRALDALRA